MEGDYMKLKRIGAYFIDVFIIAIISSFISLIPIFGENAKKNEEFSNYVLNEILGTGSGEINEEEIKDKTYEYEKDTIMSSILSLGVTVAYFGVYGYFFKGQTLGKKVLKIQIVPNNDGEELNPGLFMLREIIKNNSIFELANLIVLSVCSKSLYFSLNGIISTAGDIVLLLIIGTMIFRDDERGLHDVICKTKVIDLKEENSN
ncbi:MAG TPA: hypothetical protein DCE23_05635 [Firmicutes bacterium]|nr:hypothetical protein [Bacillota bacterium]